VIKYFICQVVSSLQSSINTSSIHPSQPYLTWVEAVIPERKHQHRDPFHRNRHDRSEQSMLMEIQSNEIHRGFPIGHQRSGSNRFRVGGNSAGSENVFD
jgi:hypothetical protein